MEALSILILNWRDTLNPEAGGAEIFTHEVAKRWVAQGHLVSLFTSRFRGAKEKERIDGVDVYRAGGKFTVYRQAARFWRKSRSQRYDVVIDEINTRPFMAPSFVDSGTKVFALIHQLAREYWFHEAPFPLSYVGYHVLERRWLERYIEVPCVTVSESTRSDLHELGFKRVCVVPEGLSVKPVSTVPEKPADPTFIYLGRLTRAKRPEVALAAFEIAKRKLPSAQLWMVGDGYLRRRLERNAPSGVVFTGAVDEREKFRLLRTAHTILVPGTREGWGLVVLEANAMGTPAIAFDIPGLRDSVVDKKTGILLGENTPDAMADWSVRLSEDAHLRMKLSEGALAWSKRFSWDLTATHFMAFLLS
jgi:glycosyltransferase involved in cell wall biosynthesis